MEGVKPAEIQIAKHEPHNFKWRYLNPHEFVTEKKKSGKQGKTQKLYEVELRMAPVLLKDGDEFGFRIESDETNKTDDW